VCLAALGWSGLRTAWEGDDVLRANLGQLEVTLEQGQQFSVVAAA